MDNAHSGSRASLTKVLFCLLVSVLAKQTLFAWDYEGHRVVNQLALASLPTNFPGFVRTAEASERIAFLAGEPDRWRNAQELLLQHSQEPEHFIDIEELSLCGLEPELLPVFRYDFVSAVSAARKAHPEKFSAERDDPAHKYIWVGLLPWAIAENFSKLKSEFSYLKTFKERGGTAEEIANAEANAIYTMGVMGHYVGDAAQPLHTTIHHHGWKGENPHGYTTSGSFHSWIDGGYFAKVGGAAGDLRTKVRPAHPVTIKDRSAKPEEMFQASMLFILEQHKLVEPLYQLDKDGKLSGEGEKGLEGRTFLEGQLLKAGQMLGDIWYSAWENATIDTFLSRQLEKRKH